MRKFILATRLTALALLLFCGVALKAQVVITANVNGVVTDPTGAVIPGATVTATNTDTNEPTVTTTDKAGVYNLRFLQIGNYTVTFKAPGFGEQITSQFVLEVDQSATRNAKLSPGGASTQVAVQAERTPLLNTEDSTVATTLDARAISNIPLMGRSLTDLTQFQPGVISTSATSSGNVSVNGSRNQGNNYTLNGLETNQNIDYGQTYNVNPDAVSQLQMTTATPSAEYGNVEGGTFLTVIKSGTNQFHGNAFINLRNYLLDAFSWGAKHTTGTIAPRSPYTNYQMGGTLGGPIIKNRLFAFGDYQGSRNHSTSHGFSTVPTYNERGCSGGQPGSACTGGTTADFSELLDPYVMCNSGGTPVSGSGTTSPTNPRCSTAVGGTQLIQLYDPFGSAPGYVGNGFTSFVGNKGLPINNPVVKYLFAHNNLLPLPGSSLGINGAVFSTTGNHITDGINTNSNVPGSGNVSTTSKSFSHSDQYDIKIDYRLSSKDNLSGSYSHFNSLGYTTPSLPITFPSESPSPKNIYTFDEIHTFSSAIVNDYRMGFMRYVSLAAATIDVSGVFGTNGDTVLGIGSASGAIVQAYQGFASQGSGIPGTLTGSLSTPRSGSEAEGGTNNTGTNIVENTFLFADNLTWLRGKHTYKIGGSIGDYQQNNFYPGNDGSLGGQVSTGLFTADQISSKTDPRYPTAAKALGYDVRGYAYADYVMDRISAADIGGAQGPVGMRQYRDSYFVNDDWKIRPNLTLNLGLRYEYNTQITEVNNKYVAPDILTQTLIFAHSPQANTYCPGCGDSLVHPYYGGLVPRVGFNWAYTPRFVIRAGYGAMTFMEGTGANLRMTTNPPFQTAKEFAASVPDTTGNTGTPYTEEQGFNHTLPGAAASGALINLWDPHDRPAYVQTFSFGVQYQMSNSLSASLTYVGKTGQHLITPGSANQLPRPCTDPSFIQAGNPTGINTTVTNITTDGPCLLSDPAPYQNVPGVGYTGGIRKTSSNGMENDNSLQAVVRQRLWRGLQYTFNFTYGHAMTNNGGFYSGDVYAQNYYNNHAEYANMVADIKFVENWNIVYDLPIGRGRQYFANMYRPLDEVLGGWVVALTGVVQSGQPSNVSGAQAANYMNGSGPERPNQYRKVTIHNRTLAAWFGTDPSTVPCVGFNSDGSGVNNGTCAFGQPSLGTFGNAHYNELRGDGNQNYNADVNKNFTIYREHTLNFRVTAQNVLNESIIGNPGANAFGGSFGLINSVKSANRSLQLDLSYKF